MRRPESNDPESQVLMNRPFFLHKRDLMSCPLFFGGGGGPGVELIIFVNNEKQPDTGVKLAFKKINEGCLSLIT